MKALLKRVLPQPIVESVAGVRAERRARAAWRAAPDRLPPFDPAVAVAGDPPPREIPAFLVGTGSGLLRVSEGRVTRLTGGHVYGIAPSGRFAYAYMTVREGFGRILRVEIATGTSELLVPFIRRGVHQIDLIDDRLYVTETYRNMISVYDLDGRRRTAYRPAGRLWNGRRSANYAHFNSVFGTADDLYLLAHNETRKTGRASALYRLGGGRVVEVRDLGAINAHNVAEIDGALWWCDSLRGGLVVDGRTVFSAQGFMTRGLAVGRDLVLLGGSEMAERNRRGTGEGRIFGLDGAFRPRFALSLPGVGGISEIRLLEGDRCLSANRSSAAHAMRPAAPRLEEAHA